MPFMHPGLFLAGTAAASVPVIIHLLNRRRFKTVEWAAMKFLWESVRRNRRRVRLEELILLLLRCLAVFLLSVAVGRFLGCAPTPVSVISTPAQMTHVFVLDDSVSMGQKLADTTGFNKAANDLAEMLKQVPSADRVAVLLTSRPERAEALFDLGTLSDPEDLAARLKGLQPSDTRARLGEALRTARSLFKLAGTDRRLYVLSDFRRADYASVDFSERIRAELKALAAEKARLVLMNYGSDPSANLTVEEVKVLSKLTLASLPIRVQARVRNNGPAPAENVAVSFILRDAEGLEAKLPAKTLRSVEPGESQLVQVPCELTQKGPGALEAHLPGDTLAGDNVGYLALDVREARRVLVVDGEEDLADPARSESYYLVAAIDPAGDHRYGSTANVVSADRLAEENFDDYELVILANVADFPLTPDAKGGLGYESLKALAEYVRTGGGLAVFAGDRVNPTFYNGPFYDRGAGLCPLRVRPAVYDRTRRKSVRLLRQSISTDPVMRAYQGQRSQFTQFVRFYGYTPAEPAPPVASASLGPVRVLARFDNTDTNPAHTPAIVARRFGDGAVMMICTSADIEWTDWPKDLTFLPFVNDMLEYLSRGSGKDFTGRVGERIDYALGPEMAAARASLQTPRLSEEAVTLADPKGGARRVLSYPDPRHAGIYKLNLLLPDEAQTVMFARNVDPAEGRLERATEQELRGWLGVKFEYQDKLASGRPDAPLSTDRREFWKAALVLMLMVLAVEVFLGQRLGHYR